MIWKRQLVSKSVLVTLNNTDNILNAQNLEEDYMEKAYENGFNFIYYNNNYYLVYKVGNYLEAELVNIIIRR